MEKMTEEQRNALRKSVIAYFEAEQKRKEAFNLSSEMTQIANGYGGGATSKIGLKFRDDLKSGKYKKPSDFFKAELKPMLGTWIPEALIPSMFYEIDNVLNYPYSESWYRRSFRSDRYDIYIRNISF